ncbi:MAG: Ig-like domain-containing protein [Aeromicrobium erythreum]
MVATVVEARTGKPATGRAELQSFTGRTWTQPLEEGRTTFRMPGYLGVDPDPQVLPLTKVRFLPAADTVQASGGESQGLSVTVRRATTTTSVTLSRSNPTADRPATATVRVEAPASASSPEGDVQVAVVKDDRYSFLGTAELHATARGVSEGSFVLDDPVFRTAGTAVLSTHYVGTSNHVGGLGTDQTLTVRPERATASVSTKLSVSSRRTGKATVTISAGRVVPTGKVTVRDGSRTLRTATLTTRSRGRATLTLPKLSRRTHTISVTYAGNDDVKPVTRSYRLKVR